MLDETSRNAFVILGLLKWCFGLGFALQARFPDHAFTRLVEPRRIRMGARTSAAKLERRRSLLATALAFGVIGLWLLLYPLTGLGEWLISLHFNMLYWLVIVGVFGTGSLPLIAEWATRGRR